MSDTTSGWVNGFLGMLIFSGSLPATRAAVQAFDPVFLTGARAVIAALLAVVLLVIFRAPRPERQDLPALVVVALGVVVGFPLLTALALQFVTSAHSIVFIGILPMVTAIFAMVLADERPRPVFWIFAGFGSACVAGFALSQGFGSSPTGDLLMLAAVLVCGLGYAQGAKLSRRMGGWQVISWALLISLPIMLPIALFLTPMSLKGIDTSAWLGLGYVSLFSMLIGFVFWYRGLALGGIAAVGQLQLLQPFFGLALAALLLGESVSVIMIGASAFVVFCVAAAKRFST